MLSTHSRDRVALCTASEVKLSPSSNLSKQQKNGVYQHHHLTWMNITKLLYSFLFLKFLTEKSVQLTFACHVTFIKYQKYLNQFKPSSRSNITGCDIKCPLDTTAAFNTWNVLRRTLSWIPDDVIFLIHLPLSPLGTQVAQTISKIMSDR